MCKSYLDVRLHCGWSVFSAHQIFQIFNCSFERNTITMNITQTRLQTILSWLIVVGTLCAAVAAGIGTARAQAAHVDRTFALYKGPKGTHRHFLVASVCKGYQFTDHMRIIEGHGCGRLVFPNTSRISETAHVTHCVSPSRLNGRQSLLDVEHQTGIPVAILLEEVAKCDGLHGGWTRFIANLLAGKYGPDIRTVHLPKGTRLWEQL